MNIPWKRPRRIWPTTLLLFLVFLAVHPAPVSAQGFQGLVDGCAQGAGGLTGRCHVAGLALDALRGGLATASALGPEIPGSASTVGYRLRSSPRWALSARTGLTRFSIPDLLDAYSLPVGDQTLTIPSFQLSGVVGVLNGFSPVPTVGGVLSLDVTASAQHLFTGGNRGFTDGLWGWGLGLRLGILRESFTLPGVSLSLARRWLEEASFGREGSRDPAHLEMKSRVTSMRAVAGKDLFGFGVFGGAGWDRISGNGTVNLRLAPEGPEAVASRDGLSSDRLTYFAGLSRTFLILQLSAEVGMSESLDPDLPVDPGGNDFPSARAVYGSLGLRLTF